MVEGKSGGGSPIVTPNVAISAGYRLILARRNGADPTVQDPHTRRRGPAGGPPFVGVPPRRINEICRGKRAISADTAVRLAGCLGNSDRFWLGLQMDQYLEEAGKRLPAPW